jgi:hypothetical protein
MRRKTTVVITREGRDKGGVFQLEEMPAFQACEWLIRAGQLLARSGADVPADIGEHGATGFVALGVGALVSGIGKAPWLEVKPLADELLTCVKAYQPPGGTVDLTAWSTIITQIEEPSTLWQLYEEVLTLIMGFSIAAALSTYTTKVVAIVAGALGQTTETSSEKSASSSQDDTQA